MKKSLPYFILAITAIGALFFIVRASSLQKQLAVSEEENDVLSQKLNDYEQLVQIDSMLLEGDYDTALKSYSSSMDVQQENKMGIPLRIALAEKLLQDSEGLAAQLEEAQKGADTIAPPTAATPSEIRKFDSLNFTLEKTKVQLTRLRKQLKNKSFGEYLTFKSAKGNQMHYVGQVKNGKANGLGIALLDSGSRYEGQWKENQRDGEGTFYWADGEYYVGTYKSDKRSGFGTYYWPNGEKYAGEWKEDKRSGAGQFFSSDGDVMADGEWSDDKLVEINKR